MFQLSWRKSKYCILRRLFFCSLLLLTIASCANIAPAKLSNVPFEYLTRLDNIGEVTSIDWNLDNTQILIGGDRLYLYDLRSNSVSEIAWQGGGPVTDVDWQPDGRLVAATNSPEVDIWDSETRTPHISLENPVQYRLFSSVSWSPASDMLAASSVGDFPRGIVRIWDISDFQITHTISPDPSQDEQTGYTMILWSPAGNLLASANLGDNTIEVWNTTTWERVLQLEGHEATISDMSWHNQEPWLASGDGNGSVIVFDVTTGRIINRYDGMFGAISSLDWKPSEDVLTIAGSDGIFLLDLSENTTSKIMNQSVNDISWSSDGDMLAVALQDGITVLSMTGK